MGSKDERCSWTVCGRNIGTATGWDQADTFSLMLYDFEGGQGYSGPTGTINVRFENGTIESYRDDGDVDVSVDLIEAISGCPVERTD